MSKKNIPIGFVKGKRIQQLRIEKGISCKDFAYEVDIHYTWLSTIENNLMEGINIGSYTLAKMANRLGVSLSELIDESKVTLE